MRTSTFGIYVVGYDPGLANAGAAVVQLAREPAQDELQGLFFWGTEKSAKKRDVLASSDDFRRVRELADNMLRLHRLLDGVAGHSVRAICAESMSFPRNARTSAQMALFWGALACSCELGQYPMVQAGPQEIRRRFGLPTKAKKPEVHEKLVGRFPALQQKLDEMRARLHGMTAVQWEATKLHPLDALAAIVAADGSEVIRMLRGSLVER